MTPACPITRETVDDRAARLCALIALLPLGWSLALRSPWPALGLAVDFGLRGFGRRRFSPVSWLSRWLASRLGLSPRPTNGGPKAFAAKLGFGFSLVLTVAFLFGRIGVGVAAGLPFALCALLEGAFGYCVGCRIYQLSHRLLAHGASRAPQAPAAAR
jgi:hypothetical protein